MLYNNTKSISMEISNNKLPKRKAKKTFMSVTGYFPSKKILEVSSLNLC